MGYDREAFAEMVRQLLPLEAMRVRAQVRQSHLALKNRKDPYLDQVIAFLKSKEDELTGRIMDMVPGHPAHPWFSQIKGVGNENIAKVIGLVDIRRAPNVSSLWKYAGYHVVQGRAPRPTRGQKLEYNAQLRVMCWRVGTSLIKTSGKFRAYYDDQKRVYTERFGLQLAQAKTETERQKIESQAKRMALRKTIKLFLSLLWAAWREAEGLPVTQPYVQAHLGHQHIVPKEAMTEPKKPNRRRRPTAATL